MSATADGLAGYLVLLGLAVLAHEPWRWLGYALGRGLDGNSEIFLWVRAVATALVAALVTRIVIFPPGALAGVPAWLRIAAFAAGVVIFFASGRRLGIGILGGAVVMVLGRLATR
jgi:branched-subunit amino acid transport protein